jgi:TonB family protein
MIPPPSDIPGPLVTPRLEVRWKGRPANFFESLRAALAGPRTSRQFDPASSFFHLRIAPQHMPRKGIAGSIVCHMLLLAAIVPLGRMAEPAPQITLPQIQITWYGPETDVAPVIAPKTNKAKPAPRPPAKTKPAVVARAYNPNTTAIFQPPRPTNMRQVLIEPDAPPTLPKFLPGMPNIIAWGASQPTRPEIEVNPNALVALRPKSGSVADSAAPQIADAALPAAPMNILPQSAIVPRPLLPLAPSAVRAERSATRAASVAAPSIAFAPRRVVALSLAPGTSVPPPGNASAPISIGPRVGKATSAVAPNMAADAAAGVLGAPAANGATPGPAGLLILHAGAEPPPPPVPRAPALLPRIAAPSSLSVRSAAALNAGRSAGSGIVPHDLAHEILGLRPIQTLLMNMPNLTSATGSWVLNFAELPGEKIPLNGAIAAPLPIRKVDPEYPPELIQQGVQGEVVLYGVIGRDGTVSQIRVVESLDPVLDHNAVVAFGKWKFLPALADNVPIDLEVLVHIPFRYQAPQ